MASENTHKEVKLSKDHICVNCGKAAKPGIDHCAECESLFMTKPLRVKINPIVAGGTEQHDRSRDSKISKR